MLDTWAVVDAYMVKTYNPYKYNNLLINSISRRMELNSELYL